MEYSGVKLHNSITVGKIFSIHYFEYMNNFNSLVKLIIFGNWYILIKAKPV